jgi:hypothetical protein
MNDDIVSSEDLVDFENNEKISDDSIIFLPPLNESDEKKLFDLLSEFYSNELCSFNFELQGWSSEDPTPISRPLIPTEPTKFDKIISCEQFHVISHLIKNWTLNAARGTGKQKSIVRANKIPYLSNKFRNDEFYMSGRIDLQCFNTQKNPNERFERYAIQMGRGHFATVHIEVGKDFSPRLIRRAFWNSIMRRKRITLSVSSTLPKKIPANYVVYRSWKEKLEKDQFENEKI